MRILGILVGSLGIPGDSWGFLRIPELSKGIQGILKDSDKGKYFGPTHFLISSLFLRLNNRKDFFLPCFDSKDHGYSRDSAGFSRIPSFLKSIRGFRAK